MPRIKPVGWPKYMVARPLRTTAYYHVVPTWAKEKGCAMGCTPLGTDYGAAKARCDDILNPQFRAWLGKEEGIGRAVPGTLDWMFAEYKKSNRYRELPATTRRDYDRVLGAVANLEGKNGRRVGSVQIRGMTGGFADDIYDRMKVKKGGGERLRTAKLAMQCCQAAWNVVLRRAPSEVPIFNPFANMKLSHEAKMTRPVTFEEMMRFVAVVDGEGEPSLGTAAMIAFFWMQRQTDILGRLSWCHYRPDGRPIVQIIHHKTKKQVDLPLIDDDGTPLFPELTERLDATERLGPLIVTRSEPDRRTGTHLPWKVDYFRHRVSEAREAAGIDPDVKFMGLRHGGATEGADAGLTDAQLRTITSHRSAALLRYVQETGTQQKIAGRKRLEKRTKKT